MNEKKSSTVGAAVIVLVLLFLAILSFFIPQIQQTDILQWLTVITSYLFAGALALGIISFTLSVILFILAGGVGGQQRIGHRSKFWLIFGAITIAIGGIIWAILQLILGVRQ